MKDSAQPLAEVFGHLITDHSEKADRYRSRRLCPFNNKVPNCTKDKAKDPLGVCSIYHEDQPVITCPIRFREDWIITDDAASFFFREGTTWSSLTEIRLNDLKGKSAGNIDVVLVAYDAGGKVYDFGALEIQAVYISGNVRDPFEYFMKDPKARASMNWSNQPNYPRPDYLSSSRKRLAPQLLFKGGILHGWRKKIAVALNRSFFDTLPKLSPVSKSKADIAWLIYDVMLPPTGAATALSYQAKLVRREVVYSKWPDFLIPKLRIPTQNASTFLRHLDVMLEKAVVAC